MFVCLYSCLYPLLLTVREEPWNHKLEDAQNKQRGKNERENRKEMLWNNCK